MNDAEMDAEIEDFIEGFNQPTYSRHEDQWRSGGYVVEPARLEWIVRPAMVFMTLPHVQDGDDH